MSQDPLITRSLLLGIYCARMAGVDAVPIPHDGDRPGEGFWQTAFRANGYVVSVHRISYAEIRRDRRQTYAHTGLLFGTLSKARFRFYHVIVPCYRQHRLLIPVENLANEYFPDELYDDAARATLHFPLVYRPARARFDSLAYEDPWDLIPPPAVPA